MKHITQILILFSLFVSAKAQELTYNLNKTNGLSTNHVYCAIVDHNGYLWMGTEDGVLRYNGYEIKKYDYNDGLPNVDVWNLVEDKNGRILLYSIARGMGYIKNNKYHSFKILGIDTAEQHIIPQYYEEIGDTIFFWSRSGNTDYGSRGIIVSDTVFLNQYLHLKNDFFRHGNIIPHIGLVSIDRNAIVNYNNKKIYKLCESQSTLLDKSPYLMHFINDRYVYIDINSNVIEWLKINDCTTGSIVLPQEKEDEKQTIIYMYIHMGELYVFSQKYAYHFNNKIELKKRYSLKTISIDKTDIPSFIIDNPFWGKGITTSNNGVQLSFSKQHASFEQIKDDFSNTTYLGKQNDSLSFWWNDTKKTMLTYTFNKLTHEIKLPSINPISIIDFTTDNYLVLSKYNTAIVSKKGMYNCTFPNYFKTLNVSYLYKGNQQKKNNFKKHFLDKVIKKLLAFDAHNSYVVTGGQTALLKYNYYDTDTVLITAIDDKKYKDVIKHNDMVVGYSDDYILFYNTQSKKKTSINYNNLKQLGINRIEHIFSLDGNKLLIQDYYALFLYDCNTNKASPILENNNIEDAIIDVTNNMITIANKFGIVQYKYSGDGMSFSRSFLNTKSLIYNNIYNLHVSSKQILLGTDKGSYRIDLTSKQNAEHLPKRFIITVNDDVFQFKNNDTINLTSKVNSFSIDVINPTGIGVLKTFYKTGKEQTWKQSIGDKVNLNNLSFGTYHKIQIRASDDAWKSNPINLIIYKHPLWWQSTTGKIIISLAILIVLSLLVLIAIVITKRVVSKKNEQRNIQRNLELKSIYSQINPHFIFNTLSTALYFVKKNKNEEAAKHISQFSELLRSYLKSSRNKYISIKEEIENLDNYLQLQLSRFEEKFLYKITIDDSINGETEQIPSLLLQPIVENALNHGLFHKKGIGSLLVEFKKGANEQEIICIVDDNGVGRKKSKELLNNTVKKADSYGNILIKELVNTFNKYEPIKIDLKYIDKDTAESGTRVVITINKSPK